MDKGMRQSGEVTWLILAYLFAQSVIGPVAAEKPRA